MFKKALLLVSILMLGLMAACSGPTASAAVSAASGNALNQITDSTKLAVKDKLGAGILSLEGTSLSVTPDQASVLLPLWQAVQSLGADKSAASTEIAAVYTQIQETLTTDQLAQIEQLTWSQEELASLIQQSQSQSGQTSSTAKSTSSTTTTTQSQNMGGGPGGDMMPPDGGIMMGSGAGTGSAVGQNTTGETQQALILSQASTKSTTELNVMLANAVINLLQQHLDA